jgi:hypothetical protein
VKTLIIIKIECMQAIVVVASDYINSMFVQFMPDTTDIESSEDMTTIPCLLYEGMFFNMMHKCKIMQFRAHVLSASIFCFIASTSNCDYTGRSAQRVSKS